TPDGKLPAVHVKYHWSNVKSYVSAAQIGVLFGGDLEYTRDGCTAKYSVVAISPKVECADKSAGDDPALWKPDPHLCVAEPDPTTGFARSGQSPDRARA